MNDIEAMNAVRDLVPDFVPGRAQPIVRRGRPTVAYRVERNDSRGVVVAKFEERAAAEIENTMYTHLFPHLDSVQSFGVHPSVRENMSWLVTQFMTGAPFDPDDRIHRTGLALHMARIHRSCADSSDRLSRALPPEGGAEWNERIQAAIETLETGLANAHVSADSRGPLHSLLTVFRYSQQNLASLAMPAHELPETVVHGDLSDSNVFANDDRSISIIDWATARWGRPVVDLAFVDLDTYRQALSPRWGIDREQLRNLQDLGCLLWLAHVIPGERETLESPWPERSFTKMDWYANWIGGKGLFTTRRGHEL